MTFLSPWMLLLLLLLPVAHRVAVRGRRLQREAADILRGGHAASPGNLPLPHADRLLLAVFACLVVALARPAWNPHSEQVDTNGRDLVIALDVSRSMLASDVQPSRLEAARVAVFESLPALRDRRIALITFAGAASVRVPLTLDQEFVRYMLDHVDPMDESVGGTSLQAAIEKAATTVFTGSDQGRRDMIILTDGEDHISDIGKTAKKLRDCGAHVLIVGLGDPVTGAKVPDPAGEGRWMQYKGSDVVSRLDESTLQGLASGSPDITYYQAGTRPFDLMSLYRKLPATSSSRPVMGGRETVYTEGAPFLIAAALLLLSAWRFPRWWKRLPLPFLLVLLLAGCGHRPGKDDAEYRKSFDQAKQLRQAADALPAGDPVALQDSLSGAREAFLLAAMFKPGDLPAAREIASLTARIRALDEEIRKQREEEKKQREELAAAIERLKDLVARQSRLAQQSQQAIRAHPPIPPEQRLAEVPATLGEQTAVSDGTTSVRETVTFYQQTVRRILTQEFGKKDPPPPTEFDEAVTLLGSAIDAQRQALLDLAAAPPAWRPVNSGFHAAAGRMKQALDSLSTQNSSPQGDEEDADNEGMEWSDSDREGGRSMKAQPGQFKTALENRSLPVPNYTAEEILDGEVANQKQRTRQKAARSGANVEKNW